MTVFKYSGAGNDFFIIDGRCGCMERYRSAELISSICDRRSGIAKEGFRTGSDGLIILGNSAVADFSMEFYNPDGSGGMMCGNGGRCVVAFARRLGIMPSEDAGVYRFEAPDGLHRASVLSSLDAVDTVRLGMKDVDGVTVYRDGIFLDTGTRHFVTFAENVEAVDVGTLGSAIRRDPRFAPQGTNVNFLSQPPDGSLHIRTFEKGVEAETLACGTGITATAIAAFIRGIRPARIENGSLHYELQAREAALSVDFRPLQPAPMLTGLPSEISSFKVRDIFLTGPAELLYMAEV